MSISMHIFAHLAEVKLSVRELLFYQKPFQSGALG
jgi:hypothetical protein